MVFIEETKYARYYSVSILLDPKANIGCLLQSSISSLYNTLRDCLAEKVCLISIVGAPENFDHTFESIQHPSLRWIFKDNFFKGRVIPSAIPPQRNLAIGKQGQGSGGPSGTSITAIAPTTSFPIHALGTLEHLSCGTSTKGDLCFFERCLPPSPEHLLSFLREEALMREEDNNRDDPELAKVVFSKTKIASQPTNPGGPS